MARVNRHWHAKTQEGVGFEEFKDFYKVLFGGKDLERAMFYLNKKAGVDRLVIHSTYNHHYTFLC